MGRRRDDSDEAYVIALSDEILGAVGLRQHRFDFLRGDPGKRSRRQELPVDAYYPALSLVVEYREKQDEVSVGLFDKPDRMTVSGVHRGEQRRLYDQRRREVLPAHGVKLIEVPYTVLAHDGRGRLLRTREGDLPVLRRYLRM